MRILWNQSAKQLLQTIARIDTKSPSTKAAGAETQEERRCVKVDLELSC